MKRIEVFYALCPPYIYGMNFNNQTFSPMKIFKLALLASVVILFVGNVSAQSGDIQISAAFSSSIDLTVTNGANISFTVANLTDYTDGLAHATNYTSTFEVNSSVNFYVDLVATDFTSRVGSVLNANNFGYTLSDNGTNVVGTNHALLGDLTSPSAYALLGNNSTIIKSYGNGNAGTAAANSYKIKFELGTAAVRAVSGLPALIEQNIAPATYYSTVTLTASAMP